MQSSIESNRPTTVPINLDEEICQTNMKTNQISRPLNPHLVNLADNFDDLTDSSIFQFKLPACESDNQFMQRSYTDTFLDSSIVKTSEETPDESKISQQKVSKKMFKFSF